MTTAPSHAAMIVSASARASPASIPVASRAWPSRSRQDRKIAAARSTRSGTSALTVTASTAQPARKSDRTSTARHRPANASTISAGGRPMKESVSASARSPARSIAAAMS
jgi:hypothetical protein